MIIVLDASVAVKWFFHDEPNAILARKVLKAVSEDPGIFAVPDLFFTEISAVIVRKSGRDLKFSRNAIQSIWKLGLRTIPSAGDGLHLAIAMACKLQLSVYDGIYLASAELTKGRWLTADNKAAGKVGKDRALTLDEYREE